ncbi:Dcp1p-Dcp2p decapping enzyme complex alpha subunit [Maudiozyma exigua]|uniref:mRNA-capping enzyme subunit alpha n=1 Tax=Maudiozyma exigua TaxID=34358 RepID=A0A9P6WCN6_MAUEX|nr:Dcp1p-Dcp2p decapping enzyme complex alpha subunit [Kazachstania exigua]
MENRMAPEIPGIVQPGNVTQDLKSIVCKLLNSPKPIKTFPGSQPVSFQHSDIQDKLLAQDYYVCEKTDGLRVLMLIIVNNMTGEQGCFMIDRENNYYMVSGFRFPRLPSKKKEELLETLQDGTLLDGELVIQTNPLTKLQELRYLMFDCLAINGRCLTSSPTSSRLAHLGKEFFKPYYDLRSFYADRCSTFPFKLSMKHMDFSYALTKVANSLEHLPHMSDGLIFTPVRAAYSIGGKDSLLLKWKPEQENTVDFKLILDIPLVEDTTVPKRDANRWYYNYDVKPTFHLYVWLGGPDVNSKLKVFDKPFDGKELQLLEKTYKKFAELEIDDAKWEEIKNMGQPVNGRIVECAKNQETGEWSMLRFRDDKLNGNHTSVVQKVLESISDSVSIEDLNEVVPDIKNAWENRKASGRTHPGSYGAPPPSSAPAHNSQPNAAPQQPKYVDDEDDWFD